MTTALTDFKGQTICYKRIFIIANIEKGPTIFICNGLISVIANIETKEALSKELKIGF